MKTGGATIAKKADHTLQEASTRNASIANSASILVSLPHSYWRRSNSTSREITKLMLDESGDTVTSCGALTNAKDQPHATLVASDTNPVNPRIRVWKLTWPGPLHSLPTRRQTQRAGHSLLWQTFFLQA